MQTQIFEAAKSTLAATTFFVTKTSVSTIQDIQNASEIIGITAPGVRDVLDNWSTYRTMSWMSNIVLVDSNNPPALSYSTRMPGQVAIVANLHSELLMKHLAEDKTVPSFTASLEDKLTWGIQHIDSLKSLNVRSLVETLASDVNQS